MVAFTGDAAVVAPPGNLVLEDDQDDALAIQRMLDDGAPIPFRRRAAQTRTKTHSAGPVVEPPAPEQRARGWAVQRVFRLYCFACGRTIEEPSVPARPGRCLHCGGTMLRELTAD
jgi:hypothetical protein